MRSAVKNKFNLKIIVILLAIYARVNSELLAGDSLHVNGNIDEDYVFTTQR